VCQAATETTCAPYLCAGAACATRCSSQPECTGGFFCNGTACEATRAPGVGCNMGYECASGQCAQNVCCATACTGACSACNLAGTAGTCTMKTPSLIAHFKMDDAAASTTAADAACYGNHGTLQEYATPDWQPGRTGGALRFNGTSHWVKVAGSASLETIATKNAFTIAAWLLRTSPGVAGWSVPLSRQYRDTGGEHYALALLDGRLTAIVRSYDGASHACTDPTVAPLDAWFHAAVTHDGTTTRAYRDGVEVCTFQRGAPLEAGETKPIIIGGNANNVNDDAQELWKGLIDDLVVYNRALSSAEVTGLAQGGPPPE
jgi:hypothetical protein